MSEFWQAFILSTVLGIAGALPLGIVFLVWNVKLSGRVSKLETENRGLGQKVSFLRENNLPERMAVVELAAGNHKTAIMNVITANETMVRRLENVERRYRYVSETRVTPYPQDYAEMETGKLQWLGKLPPFGTTLEISVERRQFGGETILDRKLVITSDGVRDVTPQAEPSEEDVPQG